MSAGISDSLKSDHGFISRDSAISSDGKIYCVLKWENRKSQKASEETLENPEMAGVMKEFARIANMQTMKEEFLEII
jgi:hypothetical protein